MTQTYTRIGSGESFVLLRSGIQVDDMPDLTLVEYAPAHAKDQPRMMPSQLWQQEMFQPVHPLICHYCGGSGREHKRQVKPCGYCFGSGWLNCQGDPLSRDVDTANALLKVNQLILSLNSTANNPQVIALLKQIETDAIAESERQWRTSSGHGPDKSRYTGD